jgi:hypothetical protein
VKIGEEFLRQMLQKSCSQPDGWQEISVQKDGKFAAKICAAE